MEPNPSKEYRNSFDDLESLRAALRRMCARWEEQVQQLKKESQLAAAEVFDCISDVETVLDGE